MFRLLVGVSRMSFARQHSTRSPKSSKLFQSFYFLTAFFFFENSLKNSVKLAHSWKYYNAEKAVKKTEILKS